MADPASLSAVIAAYLEAADRGERPNRDEVLAAHPDLADELRDFLAAGARLEGAVSPLRQGPDAGDPDETIPGPGPSAPWRDDRAPAGYVIEGELGRGGMGIVYLARHLGLNRLCALKMILAGAHSGSADVERFKTEAQAVARLNHPGIVQVFEIGEHDGKPFMALELCPGGSLDAVLKQNPLPDREAAELVRLLAEAMQVAHEAGVVHRDLKPANVLLANPTGRPDGTTRAGSRLVPKISDFGLAKQLDEAGQTRTGAVVGTPSYMPPEQARGEKAVSPLADIYTLGAILYECLAGRPPFRAATALDTLLQVLSDEPVPLRQLNARVPQDLETIAHKCLHKDPVRRYASAQDLADDLRRYLDGSPIRARPVGALERGYRWVKRNPVVSALAAAVLLVLTAGVVAAWVLAAWALSEKVKAEGLAKAESDAKGSAQRERDRAEWEVYLGRMILTQQALAAGNPARAVLYLEQCPRSQRGWEHRFLWTSLTSRQSLHGHPDVVRGVAWSPDGRRIASAGRDATVRVWDAATGREAVLLAGRTGWVTCLAWSPDGNRIATGGEDGALTVWDVDRGRVVFHLKGHPDMVESVAYRPNGKHLASGGGHGTVRVWDAETGEEVRSLQGHTGPVTCVGWCPAGRRIATGGADKTVRVWDGRTGREVRAPREHPDRVACLAWAPDGRRIASEGAGETVRVWDAETGEEVQSLPGHTGPVYSVAFSPDGKRLASGGDGAVSVWDVAKGRLVLSLAVHKARVNSVAWSPDGTRLVSGDMDGTLTVWSAETGQEVLSHQGHDEAVSSVAWSPDGHTLVSGSLDRTAKVWRADRSQEVFHLHGHGGDVTRVRFSPDGERVYGWGSANQILAWSVADGRAIDPVDVPAEMAPGPAVSPDGSLRAEGRGRAVAVFDPVRVARANAWPLPDRGERKRYHADRAARAEQEKRWFAVAFHVGRLLLDDPDSPDLQERRAKALAKHTGEKE